MALDDISKLISSRLELCFCDIQSLLHVSAACGGNAETRKPSAVEQAQFLILHSNNTMPVKKLESIIQQLSSDRHSLTLLAETER